MSNVKTINLTGEEMEVDFGQSFMCFWIQNLGSSNVYASLDKDIEPDADGVTTIPSGNAGAVFKPGFNNAEKLYISGNGKIQIVGTGSMDCPFKVAQKGGGGGGGSGTDDYNDLSNKPMIEGITLSSNKTFEQLGWYELAESDAEKIVNDAFDNIGGYISNGLIRNYMEYADVRGSTQFDDPDLYMTDSMTIEYCFLYYEITGYNKQLGMFYDLGSGTEGIYISSGAYIDFYINNIRYSRYNGESSYYNPKILLSDFTKSIMHTVTIAYDHDAVSFYFDGEKRADCQPQEGIFIKNSLSPVRFNKGRIDQRTVDGYAYSLRIYDRKLTDEEIEHNFKIDNKNFNEGGE